jgi:hypothetical protein
MGQVCVGLVVRTLEFEPRFFSVCVGQLVRTHTHNKDDENTPANSPASVCMVDF